MSRRNLLNYVYDTLREAKGQGTYLEAVQAIQDTIQLIDSKGNWEFLLARAMLLTNIPYQVGTVSYNGSVDPATVTLSGGTWDTNWVYKELKLANRRLPYRVASIDTPTSLRLLDSLPPISTTGGSYLMFQSRYALPTDCEPGRDLSIKGPPGYGILGDGVIPKRERLRSEMRQNEYRVTGPIEWYTDDDVDTVTPCPTIRFWPAPSVSLDLRLTYYRSMRIPDQPDVLHTYIDIPQTFERVIPLIASGIIMKRKEMQGWIGKSAEGTQMLSDLYNRHAASAAYDDEPEIDVGAEGNRPVGYGNQLFTRD